MAMTNKLTIEQRGNDYLVLDCDGRRLGKASSTEIAQRIAAKIRAKWAAQSIRPVTTQFTADVNEGMHVAQLWFRGSQAEWDQWCKRTLSRAGRKIAEQIRPGMNASLKREIISEAVRAPAK